MLGSFFLCFCRLLIFFSINFSEIQEFCRAKSVPKMFAKVVSGRQIKVAASGEGLNLLNYVLTSS